VAHDAFLVVASTSPETEPLEPEGWLPVTDCTHLHLLRISDGAVLDRVTLHAECALGCGGASLWGDLLTVVAAAPQTVFMLRVLPSGRFVLLHALGQHCMDDDVLVLEEHEEAERRWRAAHPGRQLPAPAPAPAPPRGAARAGGGGQREEEQEGEQQQQQLAPGAAGAAAPMLEGLKQRMLAHLYTHAAREARAAAGAPAGGPSAGEEGLPAGPRALDAFHYFFKSYEEMTIARVSAVIDRLVVRPHPLLQERPLVVVCSCSQPCRPRVAGRARTPFRRFTTVAFCALLPAAGAASGPRAAAHPLGAERLARRARAPPRGRQPRHAHGLQHAHRRGGGAVPGQQPRLPQVVSTGVAEHAARAACGAGGVPACSFCGVSTVLSLGVLLFFTNPAGPGSPPSAGA
jgi:hypothetical protein